MKQECRQSEPVAAMDPGDACFVAHFITAGANRDAVPLFFSPALFRKPLEASRLLRHRLIPSL